MALIYTINFDSRYAGYEATVTDSNGSEVSGSPVTLDSNGDATITLTTLGHYRAAVFNEQGPFGDGYSVVDCVLDEAASIAAGGGVILNGAAITFEVNNGQTVASDLATIVWDTLPDGYTYDEVYGGIAGLEPGWYDFSSEILFAQPDVDLIARFSFAGTPGSGAGQVVKVREPISALAANDKGYDASPSGRVRIQEGQKLVVAIALVANDGTAVTGFELPYAGLFLVKSS